MSEQDALTRRMEENYLIREGERKFMLYFKPESNLPLWTAGKGDHGVDIISYYAGPNDPKVVSGAIKEGDPQYVLDIYVHQNIGPGDDQFVCLKSNYNKPCPVCEYRNSMIKETPPDDADQRTKDLHDNLLDALKYKRRVSYNIINITNPTEEAKGIRVWEISHWFMERELLILAGRARDRGKGFISYAHPEFGKTVWFARTGVGAKSTKYGGYAFEDRDYDIPTRYPKEWIDGVYTIDEHIVVPTYDQVHTALWDGIKKEKESSDSGTTGVRAARREVTSEQPSAEETADEPRRRPSTAAPEETTSARQPRTAAAETNTEEIPRTARRTRDAAPEPAPTAPSKRLGRAGTEEPITEKPITEETTATVKERCPVPDGRYGIDTDKFEECDTCDIWKSCVASAERRKRDGR